MSEARLANTVRTLRFHSNGMTQTELGNKVGVTRQTIAAIEAGKYAPSLETAFRIAEAFGKPLEDVFFREGSNLAANQTSESRFGRVREPVGG